MTALKVWPREGIQNLPTSEILEDPSAEGNTMPGGTILQVSNRASRPRTIRLAHPDHGDSSIAVPAASRQRRGDPEPAVMLIGPIGIRIPGLTATPNIHVPAEITYPDGIEGLKVAVIDSA